MRLLPFDIPAWLPYVALLILLAPLLYFGLHTLARVVLEEIEELARRREWRRGAFWDAGQSRSVRQCAERLGAKRRVHRIEAVRILAELGDPTAVPVLLRATERYDRDVPFLLCVVKTLERIGDPRALPALRRLATGRHYGLMQAARVTIAALEPRHELLRAACTPVGSETLLRPASAPKAAEPGLLLRPHNA